MEKLNLIESENFIKLFFDKIKKGLKKSAIKIEYIELELDEPDYEKLFCAYIQTADQKEGVLYEAITRRYFYLRETTVNNTKVPTMIALHNKVAAIFPKGVKDKMFLVCGSKKDMRLEIQDFGTSFTLTKPFTNF